MLQYLRHKFESKHRISVERVVSGIGLFNVRRSVSNCYEQI
jgi:glucokinase